MTRQVLYCAAPLRPTEEEVLAGLPSEAGYVWLAAWECEYPNDVKRRRESALRVNLDRAMRWLAWLRKSFPETTFIAPWIASVLAGAEDADPAQREAGMLDAFAVLERCDGIVLCGGRISEGMRREMEHGIGFANSFDMPQVFEVHNLTGVAREPPAGVPEFALAPGVVTFSDYMEAYRDHGELEGLGR